VVSGMNVPLVPSCFGVGTSRCGGVGEAFGQGGLVRQRPAQAAARAPEPVAAPAEEDLLTRAKELKAGQPGERENRQRPAGPLRRRRLGAGQSRGRDGRKQPALLQLCVQAADRALGGVQQSPEVAAHLSRHHRQS
jgi:hypothetical protein